MIGLFGGFLDADCFIDFLKKFSESFVFFQCLVSGMGHSGMLRLRFSFGRSHELCILFYHSFGIPV